MELCNLCKDQYCTSKYERRIKGRMVHPKGQGQFFMSNPIEKCGIRLANEARRVNLVDLTDCEDVTTFSANNIGS